MNTKHIGNIGEAKTLSKFVEMMIPIYVSFGDNEKADFVIDWNDSLRKVQVKTSEKIIDGIIKFDLTSSVRIEGKNVVHKYNSKEIDFFVLYNMEADLLLILPIKEFEDRRAISFALDYKPSRNQYIAYNWKDYTFEKIMCVETLHETPKDSNIYGEDKVQTTTE